MENENKYYSQPQSGGWETREMDGGNRYAMKMVFSILEILSCCVGNIIAMVMGILGCIFSSKANTAYKNGAAEEFKTAGRSATICLWIGFGSIVLEVLFALLLAVLGFLEFWKIPDVSDGVVPQSAVYVEVDGEQIGIPTDYATLEAQGFSLDAYDAGTILDGDGEFGLYQMQNAEGAYVMWCWFYNDSSDDRTIEECAVIGIDVDSGCSNYEDYRTDAGLGFANTPEDFMDAYGQPDQTERDGTETRYTWYFDNGSDPLWRMMSATFSEGKLYDIDVDYK